MEVKTKSATGISASRANFIFKSVTFLIACLLMTAMMTAISLSAESSREPSQTSTGSIPSATSSNANKAPSPRDKYVGDTACAVCHRETVDHFHQTAHYLTSRLPDRNSILGSFAAGANAFTTSNPDLSFRMDAKGPDFFQTALEGIAPYTTERTERFGLVIGSGGKGQTYLYWKKDQLFQLPVSFWAELGWVNSPGYRDGVANFDRPVVPRCLECHATYFEAIPPPSNRYVLSGFVLGITCEKCHGPGLDHAQLENAKPSPWAASDAAILNPVTFSRDRQMDLCAWCHAGAGVEKAPAFSYPPGESLTKYLELPALDANTQIDVHGSQVELLEKSRCFQQSKMTCLTCHDVHRPQHEVADFAQRCLSCHQLGTAMVPKQNHDAGSNCIDCHMPRQETNLIVFNWNGKKARPKVRTHWIKVYAATERSDR